MSYQIAKGAQYVLYIYQGLSERYSLQSLSFLSGCLSVGISRPPGGLLLGCLGEKFCEFLGAILLV